LASGVSPAGTAGNTKTKLHRFTIQRSGNQATGLTALTPIEVSNPTGVDQGFGFAGVISSMSEHPVSGDLYVMGFSLPRFSDTQTFSGSESIFTLPTLAIVNPSGPASVSASQINCDATTPVKLPISGVFRRGNPEPPCPRGDTNGDRRVENADLQAVLDAWNAPLGDPRYNPNADFNHNNIVSNEDLQVILDTWADVCP
jgi:hypothetical protein